MRGDIQARFEGYTMGRNAGVSSAKECRAMEGLGRIEGGDRYLEPLNMSGASDADPVE